jgi:hypothetical protein
MLPFGSKQTCFEGHFMSALTGEADLVRGLDGSSRSSAVAQATAALR